MEARHYWGRELPSSGTVQLIPGMSKAYVRRNKNDAADAAAICEAVGRPACLVPIKTDSSKLWPGSIGRAVADQAAHDAAPRYAA
jgi:transposase